MSALAALPDPPELANVESEAALLGALMYDNRQVDRVADIVAADDFVEGVHGRIYSAILDRHARGLDANPITLKSAFEDDASLQSVGGAKYLASLSGSAAVTIGARDFALEVADLAKRRRLIEGLTAIVAETRQCARPIAEVVDAADTAMTEALQRNETTKTVTLAQAFDATLKAIEDEAAGHGPQGIRIEGLPDFNDLTGDLRRGELMYLGGRPSMGKTALALNIALGAARAGFGTSLLSLEMRTAELTSRAMTDLVFQYGDRSPTFRQVRTGHLTERDRELLAIARKQISEWPLIITDPPSLNIGRLAMEIRRHRRRMAASGQKLDLVIIDYLGLIKGSDKRAKRYEEVGDISRTLKQIAKECDVALIVLAQLNRECERREDKRPQLSDLRDAGDVEQDADHVMFVYRDEYYLTRSAESDPSHKLHQDWQVSMGYARDRIELIVAKARNNEIGKRNCYFFGAYQAVRGSDFMSNR